MMGGTDGRLRDECQGRPRLGATDSALATEHDDGEEIVRVLAEPFALEPQEEALEPQQACPLPELGGLSVQRPVG
jgi:hypothetical protein